MGILVDDTKCTGCGECVAACAVDALTMADGVLSVLQDRCIDCGACIDECPTGALSFQERPAVSRPRPASREDFIWLPPRSRGPRWP